MRIIPVLDLMGGQVVRGIAGRRQEYRPIVSRLTPSSDPLDVARALRDRFHLAEFYVADLDAIAGAAPALAIYEALQQLGLRLWVDAGICEPAQARALAAGRVDTVVLGLETVHESAVVETVCRELGPERTLFSLDLKEGQPLGNLARWRSANPLEIAGQALGMGIRRLLVLDLARVGKGEGTGTADFCRRIVTSYPGIELAAGGGVRRRDDLVRLQACGVRAALVASALHDEKLCEADWRSLEQTMYESQKGRPG
jgi:phosphoribosylformimino-5-aminoimidazole carboxamide ribotide isomerase